MRRREVVALLGSAAVLPLVSRARRSREETSRISRPLEHSI